MRVVGVDGCRGGWLAVRVEDGQFDAAASFRTFREVLEWSAGAPVVAVDIPIGLISFGRRQADIAARAFLASKAGSVFPIPPRGVLRAPTYAQARAAAAEAGFGGVTAQAYALGAKIFEVDAYLGDSRSIEVHPEVSFQAMAGQRLRYSKHGWNGFFERLRLLTAHGIAIPGHLADLELGGPDDVLDAGAAAWSAARYAAGQAQTLPARPVQEDRGRLIAIWY